MTDAALTDDKSLWEWPLMLLGLHPDQTLWERTKQWLGIVGIALALAAPLAGGGYLAYQGLMGALSLVTGLWSSQIQVAQAGGKLLADLGGAELLKGAL